MTNIPVHFESSNQKEEPAPQTPETSQPESGVTDVKSQPEVVAAFTPEAPMAQPAGAESATAEVVAPEPAKGLAPVDPQPEPQVEPPAAPPVEAKPQSSGGLTMEETVQLLTDLATLQENLAHAEQQTLLARKHVEIVQEQLAKVNEEKNSWHEQLLRQRAEFENFRKRVEREKQELRLNSRVDVIRSMLEVLDNLERALTIGQSDSGNLEAFLEGVQLIQKQLFSSLTNFGLTPVKAVGEMFDPSVHEAVATQSSEDLEPNTIVDELQRGYQLGDRLIRPARVRVAIRG